MFEVAAPDCGVASARWFHSPAGRVHVRASVTCSLRGGGVPFLDAGAVALDGESAQLSAMGSVATVAASPPGYVGSEGRGSGSPGCHSGLGGGDHLVQIWRPSMGAPPPPPPRGVGRQP